MIIEPGNRKFEGFDTIVVPAHPLGFAEVYLGQKRWPNLKVDGRRLPNLKFVAVYQTKPISAITHYASIERFEPLDRVGRYTVFFTKIPTELESPVRFTHADICAVQGPRYTTIELILSAKSLSRAFPN